MSEDRITVKLEPETKEERAKLLAALGATPAAEPLPIWFFVGLILLVYGVIVTVSGLPVKPVAMVMIYSIALQGVLTPYATGPAPIWYSTGYISTKDFWRLGFIFGVFYLGILLLVALPYALRFMR